MGFDASKAAAELYESQDGEVSGAGASCGLDLEAASPICLWQGPEMRPPAPVALLGTS